MQDVIRQGALFLAICMIAAAASTHHEPGRAIGLALGGVLLCVWLALAVRARRQR